MMYVVWAVLFVTYWLLVYIGISWYNREHGSGYKDTKVEMHECDERGDGDRSVALFDETQLKVQNTGEVFECPYCGKTAREVREELNGGSCGE